MRIRTRFYRLCGLKPIVPLFLVAGILSARPAVADEFQTESTNQIINSMAPTLIYLFLVIIGVISVFLSLTITHSKRILNVFITYQHRSEELAKQIDMELKRGNINSKFIPFEHRDFNDTINEIRHLIKACDIMIAIPGSEMSFIDAEILAASTAGKPIIFINDAGHNALPDTALDGYPVLNSDALTRYSMRPIVNFGSYIRV